LGQIGDERREVLKRQAAEGIHQEAATRPGSRCAMNRNSSELIG
jgi:hypothetical protein